MVGHSSTPVVHSSTEERERGEEGSEKKIKRKRNECRSCPTISVMACIQFDIRENGRNGYCELFSTSYSVRLTKLFKYYTDKTKVWRETNVQYFITMHLFCIKTSLLVGLLFVRSRCESYVWCA